MEIKVFGITVVEQVFGGLHQKIFEKIYHSAGRYWDYELTSLFQQVFYFRGFIKSKGICWIFVLKYLEQIYQMNETSLPWLALITSMYLDQIVSRD